MIFDRLKKIISSNDDDSSKENLKVDSGANQNDDFKIDASGLAPVSNIKIKEQTKKKTKITKQNKVLTKQSKKLKQNRESHITKSYHNKLKLPVDKLVNVYDFIEKPVISEKSANQTENDVYTFIVTKSANKHKISSAVEAIYGVKPVKVRISNVSPKPKRIRNPQRQREMGSTSKKKKAYVYLKKGDKISLT